MPKAKPIQRVAMSVEIKRVRMRRGTPGVALGRPKGSANKFPFLLKEAILLAAEQVGYDGNGKDGIVGYLRRAAMTETVAYLSLMGKVLPLQITGADGESVKVKYTMDDVRADLEKRGIPIRGVFDGPAELLVPPSRAPRDVYAANESRRRKNGSNGSNGHGIGVQGVSLRSAYDEPPDEDES